MCCRDSTGRVLRAENERHPHYAASTIKLAVLIELFRMRDTGRLDLDRPLRVHTTFRSTVDGSPYTLDRDDVDVPLAARVGDTAGVRELTERMIEVSSNEATNLLLPLLDPHALAETLHELDAPDTVLGRPIGDRAAQAAGRTNLVTAADLAALLAAVVSGRAAEPESCREMLAILGRQQYPEIGRFLPATATVAGKSGWVEDCLHDVALVRPPDAAPFILAVCTSGLPNDASRAVIATIASAAYAVRAVRPT